MSRADDRAAIRKRLDESERWYDDRPLTHSELEQVAAWVGAGFSPEDTSADLRAAILHEIGMLAVPDGEDTPHPLTAMQTRRVREALEQ